MGKKYRAIELFAEKSGNVVRTMRFHNENEFDRFLESYKRMRYPGYCWRDVDKGKNKNADVHSSL